jgi:arylsulfatase
LAVLLPALAGCGGRSPRPDLVLVTIDTLRAQSLGAYGGTEARTPNLDRLARASVLYEAATSPLPETRPAHFSLFTARLPQQHGSTSNSVTLADAEITLAEVLSARGYDTAGFVGCTLLDERSGAQQGFAAFDGGDELTRPASEVVGAARRWLAQRRGARRRDGTPFFLWVHLFDPHMPYAPPAPFDSPREGEAPAITGPYLEQVARANSGDVPAPVLARARRLYHGEVEYADQQVGLLLAELGRLPRPPLLAVTADHGECFANGTYFDHSGCLYQEAIAVPLLLHWPGELPAGARVTPVVSTVGLAPTLLRLAGIDTPPELGAPPLPLPGEPAAERTAFFQLPLYPPREVVNRLRVVATMRSVAGRPTRPPSAAKPQIGARRGSWVYLRRGGDEELYDLARDAEQARSLASAHPRRLRQLRRASREWLRRHPLPEPSGEISPETRRQLEALGYL